MLIRGSLISTCVFLLFAYFGERIFTDVLHVRYASFLTFGGIVFLVIGFRFVFQGVQTLSSWRGEPDHSAGAITMPFMIGPGTTMASVFAGSHEKFSMAALAIVLSVLFVGLMIVSLKFLYDRLRDRDEALVQRYVIITGRIMALAIGTFAIEMIFRGLELWLQTFLT